MGVLRDKSGWCFCSGGGKSERVKANIFCGKSPAMASISGGGTGFLIHRNLLLTTHANVPSVAAAEAAEVRLDRGRVLATLIPHRFFITSSVLDLTIVGLDTVDVESSIHGQQLLYLKTCCNPSLDLGTAVYFLGHTDKPELTVGEGKVVIATDNLIKLSTDRVIWHPGSAGFDVQGNLAFMVCDPMKLATSPTAKSSASSSSSLSWNRDSPTQFGIPIPVICGWLQQHWEGSLDELSKPKLPLIRLMSSGQKSESFSQRRVFKPLEGDNDNTLSSSQLASKPRDQLGSNSSANANVHHGQGIPTPEIYESRKLTFEPCQRKEITPTQLLDINFPPRVTRSIVLPLPLKQLFTNLDKNCAKELVPRIGVDREAIPELDCCSEVQSSSSPLRNDVGECSSGEETMYSAETMESRNIPSPKGNRFQQVGRSQSCVNYCRWAASNQTTSAVRRGPALQKQQSMVPVRKTRSQAASLPRRRHDYCSPTVSSSMKKRDGSKQPGRPRQSHNHVSPRLNF